MATGSTVPGSMTGGTNTSLDTVAPTGRGQANGVASLDATAQVPASQLGHAPAGGGSGGTLLIVTAVQAGNYTATAGQAVPVNTTAGNVTVTLPNAPAAGTMTAIKHIIQGGTNTVTVTCAGSDVLNKTGGGTSMTLTLVNQGVLLLYGAGIWVNLADDLPLSQLDTRYAATASVATETGRATASEALALQKASNLSDLASPAAGRTSLGLGTAATAATTAFDTAGAAGTVASAVTAETARATAAEAAATASALNSATTVISVATATAPSSGQVLTATTPTAATWQTPAGSGGTPLTLTGVKTANYTATAGQAVPCDISGGSFTVTLPNAPAAGTMTAVEITAVSGAGVNALTVTCAGSDVLDAAGGAASVTLTLLHQAQVFVYGGGVWARPAGRDSYLEVASQRTGTVYLDQYTGSDDQKMASAITAVFAAGGGTIQLSPRAHTFVNQWATTYTGGVVTGLKIQGAGVAYNGMWGTPSATTTCDMQYASTGTARIDIQHLGSIEITGIMFKDTVASTVPFLQTTNATPNIHDNVFAGNTAASGQTCYQDAILLGGLTTTLGAGDGAPYQGYQGGIYRNFFNRIRRIIVFQTFTNSTEVHSNTVSANCGNGGYIGGCIEISAGTGQNCTGNHIWGNCVEMSNYPCFIRCTVGATLNTFGPNGLYDATATTLAYYYFAPTTNTFNNVIDGFRTPTYPLILDCSGGNSNTAVTFAQTQTSIYAQPTLNVNEADNLFMNNAGGPAAVDTRGNMARWNAASDGPPTWSTAQVVVTSCTNVTDGTLTSGSGWVTSVTAAFTTADLLRAIGAVAGIPTRALIQLIATPATAIKWYASNPQALGDIARPTTANAHLYQCTTAGTTGATQPTWPTGGGTVTDGTAVWTDLGTAATAALMSKPANTTATGVTFSFGRTSATPLVMTKFNRHHILTSGAVPTGVADTGSGTSPTGLTVTGTDHAFIFSITTGASTTATGAMFHVTPAQTWTGTPKFAMTAGNAASAALMAGGYWLTVASGTVTANFTAAPTASTAYVFSFVAMV